jgi:hypothetical protein
MAVDEPKIVEVEDGEDDSDDDMPALEDQEGGAEGGEAAGKSNRSENKARKAIIKLGMKQVLPASFLRSPLPCYISRCPSLYSLCSVPCILLPSLCFLASPFSLFFVLSAFLMLLCFTLFSLALSFFCSALAAFLAAFPY